MTAFQLPADVPCLCRDQDKKDAMTGHALFCPQHKALMAELYKPQPKDVIMENEAPAAAPPVPVSRMWSVLDSDGTVNHYFAPNCNVDERGVLAIGAPGCILAVYASGHWRSIINLDARGEDGVARVKVE